MFSEESLGQVPGAGWAALREVRRHSAKVCFCFGEGADRAGPVRGGDKVAGQGAQGKGAGSAGRGGSRGGEGRSVAPGRAAGLGYLYGRGAGRVGPERGARGPCGAPGAVQGKGSAPERGRETAPGHRPRPTTYNLPLFSTTYAMKSESIEALASAKLRCPSTA